MRKVLFVEIGILLQKDNEAFSSYNQVYDKKYGYYDEDQFFVKTIQEGKEYINDYIKNGVINTYGIISLIEISKDTPIEELNNEVPFSIVKYNVEDVVYSICKDENNTIIENFINQ